MTNYQNSLNNQWFWPVMIIALILWGVYVWKERSIYPSSRFLFHVLISFLAISALALIALRPATSESGEPFKMAILTDGFDQEQLDSLSKVHSDLSIKDYVAGKPILDSSNKPNSVFILGHGIKAYDLWQLDSTEAKHLKGNDIKGITKLHYSSKNSVGSKAKFQGNYLDAIGGHKLVLENPSGVIIDSMTLSKDETQKFQLSTDLKVRGKFLFQLIEKDSLNTIISKDPLPIIVTKENQLSILIINDFPTFETKYLKNYLAKKGHQVLIRSKLTKDRYKYEYFNMTKRSPVAFDLKTLQKFDLMLIDAISLNSLSRGSINSIKKTIVDQGLGVFIQADQGFYNSNDRLTQFKFQRDNIVSTIFKDRPRIKLTTYPYKFRSEFSLQTIQTSGVKTLSAYKILGMGRVGTSILQNSYELVLNGHADMYQELWSSVLGDLSRKEIMNTEWNTKPLFAFENEPMEVSIRTRFEQPTINTNEDAIIPMTQDVDIASLWRGKTTPKNMGWKHLQLQQDSIPNLDYYVANNDSWQSLKAYNTSMANQRYFNQNNTSNVKSNDPLTQINPLWYFALFLFCVGYLWLEPKL